MKNFTILILLLISTSLFCQNYALIGYIDGKVDTFENVKSKKPVFKKDYLLAGDQKILLSEVEFYQNRDGYFRKFGKREFYKREIAGSKISTFYIAEWVHNPGGFDPNFPGGGAGFSQKKKFHYYSFNDDKLRNMTISSLNLNLEECEECLKVLKGIRKKDKIRFGIMGVGAGMLIYGIRQTFKKDDGPLPPPGQSDIDISPWAIGGVLALAIPAYIKGYRKTDMKKAIKIFNSN